MDVTDAVYVYQPLVDEANRLCRARDWPAAEVAVRKLLAAGETRGFAYYALGGCLSNLGRFEEAARAFRKALLDDPTLVEARTHLVLLTDTAPNATDAQCMMERRRWWEAFGAARYAARKPHANTPNPDRPLRVGYVSGDFRLHSAAFAIGHLLTGHSAAVQPVLYSSVPHDKYDRVTEAYQAELPWRDIVGMSDDDFIALVREDGIDVLVDLSGHTEGHRLLAFCSKPAPVQITAWGYGLGTGLDCMDAMFSDPIVMPAELRVAPRERVIDLPSVVSYDPPPPAGYPISPLPCLEQPPVFGVFQRACKISEQALRTWAAILRRVPGSRLVFRSGSHNAEFKSRVDRAMPDLLDRLEFQPEAPHPEHLRAVGRVDLALDAFSQSGGITTLEALWMGVPTVTLIGKRPGSRVGASLMINVGLPQFVAQTPEEYEEIVVQAVTQRREAMAVIRANLRQRLADSRICKGYVGAVEAAYRNLWREWCAKQEA